MPLHASAWRRLRAGDATPGSRSNEALHPFLVQHGDNVYGMDSLPLTEYLDTLIKAGSHFGQLADRAMYMVVDAHLHRARSDADDVKPELLSEAVYEGFLRISEMSGHGFKSSDGARALQEFISGGTGADPRASSTDTARDAARATMEAINKQTAATPSDSD